MIRAGNYCVCKSFHKLGIYNKHVCFSRKQFPLIFYLCHNYSFRELNNQYTAMHLQICQTIQQNVTKIGRSAKNIQSTYAVLQFILNSDAIRKAIYLYTKISTYNLFVTHN